MLSLSALMRDPSSGRVEASSFKSLVKSSAPVFRILCQQFLVLNDDFVEAFRECH